MAFKTSIIGFGNRKELLSDEVERYIKLASPWMELSVDVHKNMSTTSASLTDQLAREERTMVESWPVKRHCVALSEEGKLFTSRKFADFIGERMMSGEALIFNLGSAQGLNDSLKSRCQTTLSLSPLTFPYKLALHILVEQLYRSCTILKGHPYHK